MILRYLGEHFTDEVFEVQRTQMTCPVCKWQVVTVIWVFGCLDYNTKLPLTQKQQAQTFMYLTQLKTVPQLVFRSATQICQCVLNLAYFLQSLIRDFHMAKRCLSFFSIVMLKRKYKYKYNKLFCFNNQFCFDKQALIWYINLLIKRGYIQQ